MGWNEWEWMVNSINMIQIGQIVHTVLILYAIRCIKNT